MELYLCFSLLIQYECLGIVCTNCLPQVFELQVHTHTNPYWSDFTLNNQRLSTAWSPSLDGFRTTSFSQLLSFPDSAGINHLVHLAWDGVQDDKASDLYHDEPQHAKQSFDFRVVTVDGMATDNVGFRAVLRPGAKVGLSSIASTSGSGLITFDPFSYVIDMDDSRSSNDGNDELQPLHSDGAFDLAGELESLTLLEKQAGELQAQISVKKKAVSDHLRKHDQNLCLKHLLKECDGIVSAAKAIAHRICDKFGIKYDQHLGYKQMQHRLHNEITLNEKGGMQSGLDGEIHAQSFGVPQGNYSLPAFKPIHIVRNQSPLVRLLEALAALLGLTAIYALLKRKCMSARRRAERAADREERLNARAYRRAARRALMRKRWDNFVHTLSPINCFRVRVEEPRIQDYDEKRALILQDAFMEQDIDQAEKGEIMEAEIRELRHAHEIVSSLVGVDEHRYDLVTPVNDPPPPLVPLPYTPMTARSRASTFTLPSYTSESLPDYTSRPSMEQLRRTDSNQFAPSTTESEDGRTGPSSRSESSGHTGFTPTSSVRETSPRPSQETLRTMLSRSTR